MGLDLRHFDQKAMSVRPEFMDAYSGELIIVGCAHCVWKDLESCPMGKSHFMAVNDMIMHFPWHLHHAYSNDRAMIDVWINARRPEYVRDYTMPHKHTLGAGEGGWPWPGHGSSSLNAVYTGLAMGYDRIILCGVPLDNQPHYWQAPWERSNFRNEVGERWGGGLAFWSNAARDLFEGRVKSMSGRTQELLGSP